MDHPVWFDGFHASAPVPSGGDVDFYDRFEHTIDAKGRLVLPASLRGAFEQGGMLTFWNNYAALFTREGWTDQRRLIEESGQFSPIERQYLWSMASPFVPDAQNRIIIGPKLRQRAKLDKEVTIVGSVTHAAIYDRMAWQAIETTMESDSSSLDDKFAQMGIL